MPNSLEKLVQNLKNSNYEFPITKQIFSSIKNLSTKSFDLLLQKQIYPYEYIDNFNKFNEQNLPLKEDFYSSLNYNKISEEDYKHPLSISTIFPIKSLHQSHDLYLL